MEELWNDIKRLPTSVKIAAVAALVTIVFILWYRYQQNTNNNTQNALTGPTYGALPIDTSAIPTGMPVSSSSSSTQTTQQSTYPAIAFVRPKYAEPNSLSYDQKYNVIPVRASPTMNSKILYTVPFGSAIELTSGPITGGTEGSGIYQTSNWYQVSGGGFISEYDLALHYGSIIH